VRRGDGRTRSACGTEIEAPGLHARTEATVSKCGSSKLGQHRGLSQVVSALCADRVPCKPVRHISRSREASPPLLAHVTKSVWCCLQNFVLDGCQCSRRGARFTPSGAWRARSSTMCKCKCISLNSFTCRDIGLHVHWCRILMRHMECCLCSTMRT
jgi:hypothetical protein